MTHIRIHINHNNNTNINNHNNSNSSNNKDNTRTGPAETPAQACHRTPYIWLLLVYYRIVNT